MSPCRHGSLGKICVQRVGVGRTSSIRQIAQLLKGLASEHADAARSTYLQLYVRELVELGHAERECPAIRVYAAHAERVRVVEERLGGGRGGSRGRGSGRDRSG